jgi:ketosteroid isomerase-like protein
MDRDEAVSLLDRLHAAQNEFYGGGGDELLRELLAPDVAWTVPGANSIAGAYEGIEAVFDYFRRRRDLAAGTFRMTRRDVLAGDGDRIAALTDGSATIDGVQRHWSTVGLYEVAGGRIAACWLLPLKPSDFDAIWTRCDVKRDRETHVEGGSGSVPACPWSPRQPA